MLLVLVLGQCHQERRQCCSRQRISDTGGLVSYKNLPRHTLWLNWMIKERFGVPKGIHMQDLDQNPS